MFHLAGSRAGLPPRLICPDKVGQPGLANELASI
jgi:hypothetical protein